VSDRTPPVARAALVAEAGRKSRVCWLSDVTGRPRLVWHVWHDGALVVVSGDEGQLLTGVASACQVDVAMRSKDTGGLLVTWTAEVEPVAPGSDRWEEHAHALLAVRLNLRDPAETLEAWRREAAILRLTPVAETVDGGPGPLP
jgi:hypothetical protein